MDVSGVGQSPAGFSAVPETVLDPQRSSQTGGPEKLGQVRQAPLDLLSNERLGRELVSLGLRPDAGKILAARALMMLQGSLDLTTLLDVDRSLQGMTSPGSSEAEAAAFLVTRQLPANPETVSWVLGRQNATEPAGMRMLNILQRFEAAMAARSETPAVPTQSDATAQPSTPGPQPQAPAPSAPAATTPAGPKAAAPAAATPTGVASPAEPAAPSAPAPAPGAPATPVVPSSPTAPPASEAGITPPPAAEPQAPETPQAPAKPAAAPASAAPAPATTAPAAPATAAPATSVPQAAPMPQPTAAAQAIATAAAELAETALTTATTEAAKSPKAAPVATTQPPAKAPETPERELFAKLQALALPEGKAKEVETALRRLVQALRPQEADLARGEVAEARERLSTLAAKAIAHAPQDPTVREAHEEIRFQQVQSVRHEGQTPHEFIIPVWWKGGSGEIRVQERPKGAARRSEEASAPVRVVVALDTPHLGAIRIDLLLAQRQVNCLVAAQDQGAADFLSARLTELRSAIEDTGIRVNAMGMKPFTADAEALGPGAAKGVDIYG